MLDNVDDISKRVNLPPKTYRGADGILRCSECGYAVEKNVVVLGVKKIVHRICICKQKEIFDKKQSELAEEREKRRFICFKGAQKLIRSTFAADDHHLPDVTKEVKNYADNFAKFKHDGSGLLLHGPRGTGKTFLAACVANSLINNEKEYYTACLISVPEIVTKMQSGFEERKEFLEELTRFSLLVIDDLDAERNTKFAKEATFEVVNRRYNANKPMIVTTNLELKDLIVTNDKDNARIYDRILETCAPILVSGESRRITKAMVTERK